jgi:Flp pilus assembly protein TadG
MTRRRARPTRWQRLRRDDRGIVAVLSVILAPIMFGLCAFSVDCGNWYATVERVQRAADAAALAGVPYLPGDLSAAKAQALKTAAANGFTTGGTTVVDPEPVPGQPSRLQVTITTVVNNTFGQILGVGTTKVRRTAIATYQQPLPMGSPCNEFGNGPEPVVGATNQRSSQCASAGDFWANVGSPRAKKSYGDAYQDGNCTTSDAGTDNCTASGNSDYATDGYFYEINLSKAVTNLTIQAFDPAFVSVGDLCSTNFGSSYTAASYAKNQYNYNPSSSASTAKYLEDSALYASGQSSKYCTGDQLYSTTGQPPDATFTIRQPSASSSLYDPTSFPVISGCTQTFKGFNGDLYTALNQYKQVNGVVQYSSGKPVLATTGSGGYQQQVASEFRQWVTLCTVPGTTGPGTYFVQVQTNASGDNVNGDGHNRFALRAYGSSSLDNTSIAITGLTNMAIYADLPSAHTSFYLTQVPPTAAGQVLDVRLFDIGDSSQPGTVKIVPPTDSNVSAFSGCTGSGPTSGALSNCSIPANSSYNGKWETISVPIPSNYTCSYPSATGCWFTLSYDYGSGQPSDTTSWQASLEGSPVRLVL